MLLHLLSSLPYVGYGNAVDGRLRELLRNLVECLGQTDCGSACRRILLKGLPLQPAGENFSRYVGFGSGRACVLLELLVFPVASLNHVGCARARDWILLGFFRLSV